MIIGYFTSLDLKVFTPKAALFIIFIATYNK